MQKTNVIFLKFILIIIIADIFFVNCSFASEPSIENTSLYIFGTEYGPELEKVVLTLSDQAEQISYETIDLSLQGIPYMVSSVFLSDDKKHVEIVPGDPIEGDETASLLGSDEYDMKKWADSFQVVIDSPGFNIDGTVFDLHVDEDCINNRICPDLERFNYRSSWRGEYENPRTGEMEVLTIQTAAYEPEMLAGGEKNPLVIWLHGYSEGGQILDMCVLAYGADALAREEIQSNFTTGDVTGAYVLIPQCPTYWMDEGDAEHYTGCGDSMFIEALRDTINDYLEHNPDVDRDRIYIGGASNGAYMTMNMLVNYPDMFAAAFPVCGGYSYYAHVRDEDGHIVFEDQIEETDSKNKIKPDLQGALVSDTIYFTSDMIETIKHIPIWFVSSIDDGVLAPWLYVLPDYCSLIQAGAEHCFLSMFNTYNHSVWRAVLQNKVTGIQDSEAFMHVEIPESMIAENDCYPLEPTDEGGGVLAADGYHNLFAWLNSFTR